MSTFEYSDSEKELNKVLKRNQDNSNDLLNDNSLISTRKEAESNISSSEELLKSLGYDREIIKAKNQSVEVGKNSILKNRPKLDSWESIVDDANKNITEEVELEDLLTLNEINGAFRELQEINCEFSRKTTINNKIDLNFLAIATALQVTKVLVFPYIAEKFGYGDSFDKSKRLSHNDKSIEKDHKDANNKFRDKHLEKHEAGYWINLLYQTPPYDTTVGSKELGIHRLHTLGHDPILGWFFGTANILTDIITINNFQSYRVERKPKMKITAKMVPISTMFYESYTVIKEDFLNLPAAIFAQAQHLKSDIFTKQGLPVPLLEVFNENFASKLYKSQYDSLCLARDVKIVGASYTVSVIFDIIISLVHALFRKKDESKDLFEVRTRKILLISNSIATSSSLISAYITKNPKKLDIGSLLSTVSHLFTDIRFITRIKEEFIQSEIDKKLQVEFAKINRLYDEI